MNAMFGGFNDPLFAPPAANIIEAFLLFDPLLRDPTDLLLPASQFFNICKIGQVPPDGVITILQSLVPPNDAAGNPVAPSPGITGKAPPTIFLQNRGGNNGAKSFVTVADFHGTNILYFPATCTTQNPPPKVFTLQPDYDGWLILLTTLGCEFLASRIGNPFGPLFLATNGQGHPIATLQSIAILAAANAPSGAPAVASNKVTKDNANPMFKEGTDGYDKRTLSQRSLFGKLSHWY